jgi:cell division GTPase FtsZ
LWSRNGGGRMTREEAINILKQVNHILVNDDDYWLESTHEPLNTAFSMAIETLEQEPCEDEDAVKC